MTGAGQGIGNREISYPHQPEAVKSFLWCDKLLQMVYP